VSERFGVAIFGAGVIGKVHAVALAGLDDARLVAVVDPLEEAGAPLAAAHGAVWSADAAPVLARDDVAVVVLATPSGMHAAQAVAAAAAAKHVVCEKPMATTLADADRMIAACRAAGVALAVIFQGRYHRDARRLRRVVAAGLLGRPILANAFVHWHRTPAYYAAGGWRGTWALDGGGALMNQSIHAIDLLQWVMGPVASLSAEVATITHAIATEDTASAALRFASGALGAVQGTTAAGRDWPVRIEVVGSEGRAVLTGGRLTALDLPADRAAAVDDLLSPADLAETADAQPDEPLGAAHGRQLAAVFAALRAGQEPPVAGEEARPAVEIILGIYRAAATGQAVVFPLLPGSP
jgi:predicted dehydrogenase